MSIGLDDIIVLQIWVYGLFYSIDVNHIVNDLQRVAWGAHATLHVVLASVHRAHNYLAKNILSVLYGAFAVVVAEGVVIRVLHLCTNGVTRWEVEYYDIAFLYFVPTFQALVLPLWVLYITLAAPWEGVLYEWHGEWCVRHACAICHLVYAQEVAHTQCLLQ